VKNGRTIGNWSGGKLLVILGLYLGSYLYIRNFRAIGISDYSGHVNIVLVPAPFPGTFWHQLYKPAMILDCLLSGSQIEIWERDEINNPS